MNKNYIISLACVLAMSLMTACQNDNPIPKPEPEKPGTEKPDPGKPLELKFDTVISGEGLFYELTDGYEKLYEVSKITIDGVEYQISDKNDYYSVMDVDTWPIGKLFRISINYLEGEADRKINISGNNVDINIIQKPVDKAQYDKQNVVVNGGAQTLEFSDRGFFDLNMAPTVLMHEQDVKDNAVVQRESETMITVHGRWSKMYRYYPEGGIKGTDIKIELQENNTGKDRVLYVHNNMSYKRHMIITQKSL